MIAKVTYTTIMATTALSLGSLLLNTAVLADGADVGEFSVSMEQATTIALGQVQGTLLEAEVESEDGTVIWEIEIRDADGTIYEVELDANTGIVLEVEEDD